MALKAEVPLLDYIEVSLKCKREEEKMVAKPLVPVPDPVIQGGANKGAVGRVEQAVPNLMAGEGQAKPGSSWREEYLIAKSSTNGRLVCMVCGGILSASGPAAAREHILQHHAHSMDFSPEEKQNILEAWSEGQTLTDGEMQTYLEDNPGKREQPAEIDVLLDPEEQPANRKPGQPKARCETVRSDPGQRSQGQRRVRSSDGAKDVRSDQPGQVTVFWFDRNCGGGHKYAFLVVVAAAAVAVVVVKSTRGKRVSRNACVPGQHSAEIRIFTGWQLSPPGFAFKSCIVDSHLQKCPRTQEQRQLAKKRMGINSYRDTALSLCHGLSLH
uniref:Uncharacterized protein n=1 Tax=Sphaerodactylus townsendi TaxID=933632 RepID=A0ACB8G869_9SAUR